jgi:hypothetical protein
MRALALLLAVFPWATSAQSTAELPGKVDSQLVGKWCYINPSAGNETLTNSCITLNDDGSYEIRLDKSVMPVVAASFPGAQDIDYGRWAISDNRVYYRSDARGPGSLSLMRANHPRLENMPTVILDGMVFGTASGHDPW